METTQDTQLVESVLEGNCDAWQELLTLVHQAAIKVVEKRELRRDEDFAHNVALRTIERLEKAEHRCLKQFTETQLRYPTLTFRAWLGTLIRNSVIDELRARPDYTRQRIDGKRTLAHRPHVQFGDEHATVDGSSSFQRRVEARRVVRWIQDPEFPEDQRRAILLWLDGHRNEEIAMMMGLETGDASRLLRAARQRLRRHFEVTP
jgi:RNA polymerase sigma factor (sigma-70 family)